MRPWAIGAVLAGCNQFFELRETREVDAAYFDAPLDAPFACPPIGTPPTFGRLVYQATSGRCRQYAVSDTGAIAVCQDSAGSPDRISEGPVGGDLVTAMGFAAGDSNPRISPEGDVVLVTRYIPDNPTPRQILSRYQRDAASWSFVGDLPVTIPRLEVPWTISSPTRGPDPRMLVRVPGSPNLLRELDVTTGSMLAEYTPTDLGLDGFASGPVLSADGLRFVMSGFRGGEWLLFYGDRPDIGQRFGVLVVLNTLSATNPSHLPDDCSRLYFTGLELALYVRP
jgi:hypothetical protein